MADETKHGCHNPVIISFSIDDMCSLHGDILKDLLTDVCAATIKGFMKSIGREGGSFAMMDDRRDRGSVN